MAPVIWSLKKTKWAECKIIATAQHREMLDQMLQTFKIMPDLDLNIMSYNQPLITLTAKLIPKIDRVLNEIKPDCVLAQGDTNTAFCVAIGCFFRKILFGHVEAGLRTGNKYYPFPEEMNRVLISHLADLHFAPTEKAKENLLKEGIPERNIYVTGNTVIDALLKTAKIKTSLPFSLPPDKKLILVTVHRRDNFGKPLRNICLALKEIAESERNVIIVYPVHLNPNVRKMVERILSNHARIKLLEPLDYLSFVALMKKAYLILTDSGGIQEEAPALGKPVLVLRNETERPEALPMSVVKLVGADQDTIVKEVKRLLRNKDAYADMARRVFPYGDGHAASKIVKILKKILEAG